MSSRRLEGKICLVTGAGRGIGRAIVDLFTEEGGTVYATDILDHAPWDRHAAHYSKLDVAREEDWTIVTADIARHHDRIDVLVNNAGIVECYEQIHETSNAQWDRVIAVNQTGTFYGMRAVLPMMIRGAAGSIVNFSSIWGSVGAAGAAPYQAAKGAVRTMTKNAAVSYAKHNVRVNSVHPGIIWTPLIEGQPEDLNASIIAATPMGRAASPREVAFGCLFLASDESSFVTGIELNIDGGYLAQ